MYRKPQPLYLRKLFPFSVPQLQVLQGACEPEGAYLDQKTYHYSSAVQAGARLVSQPPGAWGPLAVMASSLRLCPDRGEANNNAERVSLE